MSCAQFPQLCGQSSIRLRGPLALPPTKGWRIIKLPESAAHLQGAWNTRQAEMPTGSKSAWMEMQQFLKANGVKVPLSEIQEISIEQWCEADTPTRCIGYRNKRIVLEEKPKLPWAKALWESVNNMLNDEVLPEDVVPTVLTIVNMLTDAINSPEGCPICAEHWASHLAAHPVPETPTLDEARHWLWARHNDSREGKTPVPYEEIALKFNWN